jgi:nucleotide-binding universal stress UspA family protein
MKAVLAVADGGPALDATIRAAGHLAGLVGGQLDVLHVRDALARQDRLANAALGTGGAEMVMEANQRADDARAVAARSAYDRLAARLPQARFLDRQGDEASMVAAWGRVSDVVVVGRPGSDVSKPEPPHVRAAIFDTARPVLVVPPSWEPRPIGHALVTWNGSAQASRALGYAMPLLEHAARTTVLSVGPPGERAPTSFVVAYLARHGVNATGAEFDAGTGSARARGRALLGQVDALGADLLVMGAYGEQGLLRFLGLGGATGKVIAACKVPVLLAR